MSIILESISKLGKYPSVRVQLSPILITRVAVLYLEYLISLLYSPCNGCGIPVSTGSTVKASNCILHSDTMLRLISLNDLLWCSQEGQG